MSQAGSHLATRASMKKPQASKPRNPRVLATESLAQVIGGSDVKISLSYSKITIDNFAKKTASDDWEQRV